MRFDAMKNPDGSAIGKLATQSPTRKVRRILDPVTLEYWYWPAEQATHAEAAERLGITGALGGDDIVVTAIRDK